MIFRVYIEVFENVSVLHGNLAFGVVFARGVAAVFFVEVGEVALVDMAAVVIVAAGVGLVLVRCVDFRVQFVNSPQ